MTKSISEIKCTCIACGRVWYYGKSEALNDAGNSMVNLGKNLMACGTCCLPLALIPDQKVVDHNKCPNCGSSAIKKETVVHEINTVQFIKEQPPIIGSSNNEKICECGHKLSNEDKFCPKCGVIVL